MTVRIAVVGGGVVGLSTLAELIESGYDATGYDCGSLMGERSLGSSRILRFAHVDTQLVRVARLAHFGFDWWSSASDRPMLLQRGCVISGTDMADRAEAMAAAEADYELIGAGCDRLRIPVVDEPAAALLDVGGGVGARGRQSRVEWALSCDDTQSKVEVRAQLWW